MEIEKKTVINIRTTDGILIKEHDICLLQACGYSICGEFAGLTKYGALRFKSVVAGTDVTFNIRDKSIEKIYLVNIIPMQRKESDNERTENDE